MTIVSIHQPSYWPWFGLIDKIQKSDVFIVLDSVQYNKRSFQNRTLYSSGSGSKYLTIPVLSKGYQESSLSIKDIKISETGVFEKHYKTLSHRYGKSPGWSQFRDVFQKLVENPPTYLIDATIYTLMESMKYFSLNKKIHFSSELGVNSAKSQLMLELTMAVNGKTYLSGQGAKKYMDDEIFASNNINVIYQDFSHPVYSQSHDGDFCSGCFALEALIEDPTFRL